MGRTIRRVPADWRHPTFADYGLTCPYFNHTNNTLLPLYDKTYEEALAKWEQDRASARAGTSEWYKSVEEFEEECEKPEPGGWGLRRRSWTPEEATHYQMYETVSEGTPTSPVFETLQELEDWLVKGGVYSRIVEGLNRKEDLAMYQEGPYLREAARAFCKSQWVPSLLIAGSEVYKNVEIAGTYDKEKHE